MSLPPSDALYSGCRTVPRVSLVIPQAISSSLEKAYLFFWLPLPSKSPLCLYMSFNLSNDLNVILTPTWPSLISGFCVLLLHLWTELLSTHRDSNAIMSNSDLSQPSPCRLLFSASVLSYRLSHVAFSFVLSQIAFHALAFLPFFQSSQQDIFHLAPLDHVL